MPTTHLSLPLIEEQSEQRLRRGSLPVEHSCVPLEPERPHDQHNEGVGRPPIRRCKLSRSLWPPLPNRSLLGGNNAGKAEARRSSRPNGRRVGTLQRDVVERLLARAA
jgi:hypothetical protein